MCIVIIRVQAGTVVSSLHTLVAARLFVELMRSTDFQSNLAHFIFMYFVMERQRSSLHNMLNFMHRPSTITSNTGEAFRVITSNFNTTEHL